MHIYITIQHYKDITPCDKAEYCYLFWNSRDFHELAWPMYCLCLYLLSYNIELVMQ